MIAEPCTLNLKWARFHKKELTIGEQFCVRRIQRMRISVFSRRDATRRRDGPISWLNMVLINLVAGLSGSVALCLAVSRTRNPRSNLQPHASDLISRAGILWIQRAPIRRAVNKLIRVPIIYYRIWTEIEPGFIPSPGRITCNEITLLRIYPYDDFCRSQLERFVFLISARLFFRIF